MDTDQGCSWKDSGHHEGRQDGGMGAERMCLRPSWEGSGDPPAPTERADQGSCS